MVEKKLIEEVVENMKNYNTPSYFKTGFLDLDDLIGLRKKGALITIGARPAMGKTAFMLNIISNQIKQNKKCLLFSLEMSEEQVVNRLICQTSETDSIKIRMGKMELKDWNKIENAAEKIANWDLLINDKPGINIYEIEECIKEVKPEVVFIDYLQLISAPKKMDRYTQIEYVMKELKRIAIENELVIFINSQLSRSPEQRCDKRPLLSDLRESGGIENISDIVLFIYRDEYYNFADEVDISRKGIAEIIVAKNKLGPCGTVNLKFVPKLTKFYNLIKEMEF